MNIKKIKLEDLTDAVLDSFFCPLSIQQFYGRVQDIPKIIFDYDNKEWEFFPYHDCQVLIKPYKCSVNHEKSKYWRWTTDNNGKTLMAEDIKRHFGVI